MSVYRYSTLKSAIRGTCQVWCDAHGYTDPFCRDGEWWAFPPHSVMPVRIATVMGQDCQYWVKIGSVMLALLPDGSLARSS